MDNQDRLKGCIPPHFNLPFHQEIFPFCGSFTDIRIQNSPIRSVNSSKRVDKDISTSCSLTEEKGHTGPCLPRRLDHPRLFTQTSIPTRTRDNGTPPNAGMDYKLAEFSTPNLTVSRVPRPPIQFSESHYISPQKHSRWQSGKPSTGYHYPGGEPTNVVANVITFEM